MKIEPVREVRNRLSEMIKTLSRGPVIITKNGRPCAALVSLGKGADLEAFLLANDPRLAALIERAMSKTAGTPLEQVEREVSRREGRRRPRR